MHVVRAKKNLVCCLSEENFGISRQRRKFGFVSHEPSEREENLGMSREQRKFGYVARAPKISACCANETDVKKILVCRASKANAKKKRSPIF